MEIFEFEKECNDILVARKSVTNKFITKVLNKEGKSLEKSTAQVAIIAAILPELLAHGMIVRTTVDTIAKKCDCSNSTVNKVLGDVGFYYEKDRVTKKAGKETKGLFERYYQYEYLNDEQTKMKRVSSVLNIVATKALFDLVEKELGLSTSITDKELEEMHKKSKEKSYKQSIVRKTFTLTVTQEFKTFSNQDGTVKTVTVGGLDEVKAQIDQLAAMEGESVVEEPKEEAPVVEEPKQVAPVVEEPKQVAPVVARPRVRKVAASMKNGGNSFEEQAAALNIIADDNTDWQSKLVIPQHEHEDESCEFTPSTNFGRASRLMKSNESSEFGRKVAPNRLQTQKPSSVNEAPKNGYHEPSRPTSAVSNFNESSEFGRKVAPNRVSRTVVNTNGALNVSPNCPASRLFRCLPEEMRKTDKIYKFNLAQEFLGQFTEPVISFNREIVDAFIEYIVCHN